MAITFLSGVKRAASREVLIVARTRMGDHYVCIGGFDIAARKNIRLLSSEGKPPTKDVPYQIGEIWSVSYTAISGFNIVMPHAEDVAVSSYHRVKQLGPDDLLDFIYSNCPVKKGAISTLFSGHLLLENGSACIEKSAVPDHSVCFWEIENPLEHHLTFGRSKYIYEVGETKVWLPYVGTDGPIDEIQAPGLVRASLARWWTLAGSGTERKCYLQLSGWY